MAITGNGTFSAGDTIYLKWTTRTTTGAPTTLSGSPVVSIYKDNSTTESVTGVTLTVDFDSRTGLNHLTIDTTQDATFYANGHEFWAVITTGTVGGVSVVGEVVDKFVLSAASTAQTGDSFARLGAPAGASIAADIAEVEAETDGIAAIPTTPFLAASAPANFSSLGITAGGKISGVVLTDTLTTYTGDTPQTGDSFARIGSTGSGLTSLSTQSSVNTLQTTANAIGTEVLALGSPAQASTALATNTVMPEGYSTKGGTATLANLLHEINQHLQEMSISGTTMTIKKRDGSTNAETLTLNDATNPTSVTRAT